MSTIPEKLKNKLSIAAKRLNNSDECQNCGTALQGPYCHYCGQPDKNFSRFFPALLREMMGDLLDLDSRLTRTLKPLLFQPGKLADDYMHGRRFRYTSPVRLYLFSSIIFFLLAGFITNIEIQRELDSNSVSTSMDNIDVSVQLQDNNDTTGNAGGADATEPKDEANKDTLDQPSAKEVETPWSITLDLDENGDEIDAVNLPLVPQRLNDWINKELAKSESKGRAIEANPKIFADKIFEMLPLTVFILLPLFALLLKFFYIFRNRYYTEHLIFSLYHHSFFFVLATVILALESGTTLLVSLSWIAKSGNFVTAMEWLSWLLLAWLPLYFWLALKRFYRQGWLITSVKFVGIGIFYFIILISVTAFLGFLSFLLL